MRDVFDFEAAAYERLDRATYNYHGSRRRQRVHHAKESRGVRLGLYRAAGGRRPRPSRNGRERARHAMAFPIMLAPSAAHEVLHPDKEAATYAGCKAASGTPMIVSHVASMSFADIAKADGGPLWFQLYPREELEQNREPVESAQEAGAGAIVVTIDQQASFYDRGYHDRNLSLRRRRPPRYSGNAGRYRFSSGRMWYEWKLFDDLRTMVKVPMLAKGILTGEDALLAVEHGLDGIIVSNHGGRTLDYTPSSLEVLPEIVEAVAGRIPVLIDSGFRRGSDIVKAMALGASAICLGRVPRWGLGSFGAPGVTKVLEIVQEDFRQAMASCGAASLGVIDRSLVRTDFP